MATTRTLFISPDILKELFVYDTNIDEKIISASIWTAQEYYIKRVVGTQLYNRIANEINGSLSTDVKTLLDEYIEPTLIHYTNSELYKYITYRVTNKGMVVKDSDNSTPIDTTSLQKLREEEISRGNVYAEILYRYLLQNNSIFPEFTQVANLQDIIPKLNYDKIGYGYANKKDDDNYYKCYCG